MNEEMQEKHEAQEPQTTQEKSEKSKGLTPEQLDRMYIEEMLKLQRLAACEEHAVDLSVEYTAPTPIIEMEESVIASEGNISAIVGEAKSKKTFLCSALVGDLIRMGKTPSRFGITKRLQNVLWVDTEQSELHARRVAERILKLTNSKIEYTHPMFKMLTLRELDPVKRREVLYDAIEVYKPKLVVIDGISDLQFNTNDLEESERIVTHLMALSTIYNCHIMCVLHTNPGSDKARGHTGSALQRKAETVLYVRKVGDVSVVEPQFCRNEPFERFAFRVNEDALPEPCDLPSEGKQGTAEGNDVVKIMGEYFPDGVSRTTLTKKIVEVLGVPINTARSKVFRAIRKGFVEVSGEDLFLR